MLSESYSLGYNADRQLGLPASTLQQSLFLAEAERKLWLGLLNSKNKCLWAQGCCVCQHVWWTCETTWLLFALCVKTSVCTICACVYSTDQTEKGEMGKYRLAEPWNRIKSNKSSSGSSIPELCRGVLQDRTEQNSGSIQTRPFFPGAALSSWV